MKLLTAVSRSKRSIYYCLQKYSSNFTANTTPLDYEKIFRTGDVPEYFNFAGDVFDWHLAQNPSKLALWVENDSLSKQWSFAQLGAESVKASIVFQKLLSSSKAGTSKSFHPQPMTNIFVLLPRVPQWWFIYLGSIRLGTVFCPGTVQLSAEDIAFRLKASRAKIVITDDSNMWKIEEAQRLEKFPSPIKIVVPRKRRYSLTVENWLDYKELTEDVSDSEILSFRNTKTKSNEIAEIFFTSGTTGKPKMVAHSHSSYGIGHYQSARVMGLKCDDLYWGISDPGWAKSSYGNFFIPWTAGAGIYIHQMERFETKRVLETLCSRPITYFCSAPTFFRSIVQETKKDLFNFKSLRYSISGGEALNPEVDRAWKEKVGCKFIEEFPKGQFEEKEGSLGISDYGNGYDLKIIDDEGKELPPGKEGNIAIKIKPKRPIGLFKGYLKEGEKGLEIDENHKCYVGDYYLTGDLGFKDEDGYFFYVGRSDDVIISAGYRIGPFEVESVLQSHPAVVENAVIPSPHSVRGSVVKAYIVLTEEYKNHDPEILKTELQNYCKQHTAPYKYPRRIEFVESLPKTVSGKIIRRELKLKENLDHDQERLKISETVKL